MPALTIRPWSHVGWLMLQWLGVLVPGAFRDEVRRAAQAQGKSVYQRIPNVAESPVQSEVFDVDRRLEEATLFEAGEVMAWPNVESMLRGDLPDGYEAALLRAAVTGDGVAITRVDPAAGTVTVSTDSRPRCPRCGAGLGGSYGDACMNCDVDT
jgi:hypothetical protein